MVDSRTRKLDCAGGTEGVEGFLARHRAALVQLSGKAAGREFELEVGRIWIGRGRDADFMIDDASMSRAHAAVEFGDRGFRIRDLGSTNGVQLNGSAVRTAELKHGDRIQLGETALQFLVEERSTAPPTYELSEG